MRILLTFLILFMIQSNAFSADYRVREGQLHKGGKVEVHILSIPDKFKVQMDYDVKKKPWVPVPSKLLKGKTVMEFPEQFKTEEGYQNLQREGSMEIPKAKLKFVKRMNVGNLKDAYLIEVLPTNKKSKIEITYHPKLPAVGWSKVEITFLSNIPILNGYEIIADLK